MFGSIELYKPLLESGLYTLIIPKDYKFDCKFQFHGSNKLYERLFGAEIVKMIDDPFLYNVFYQVRTYGTLNFVGRVNDKADKYFIADFVAISDGAIILFEIDEIFHSNKREEDNDRELMIVNALSNFERDIKILIRIQYDFPPSNVLQSVNDCIFDAEFSSKGKTIINKFILRTDFIEHKKCKNVDCILYYDSSLGLFN
jgi:hypothetical protein